jgi:hypothetical protein
MTWLEWFEAMRWCFCFPERQTPITVLLLGWNIGLVGWHVIEEPADNDNGTWRVA